MSSTQESIKKFREAISTQSLLKKGDCVIVAFSGGPDSVVLAHLLKHIQKEFRLKIILAHVNHRLRGSQADKEEAWTQSFAKKYGLISQSYRLQWPKGKKLDLQNQARKKRYTKLLLASKKYKANKLAMGHHADDQLETVLMRFFQGASLEGLAGIPIKRSLRTTLAPWGEGGPEPVEGSGEGEVTIVRPLMFLSKKEILQYAKAFKLKYLQDPSNKNSKYWRSGLRNKLIPGLEKKFSSLSNEMTRLALSLRSDADYFTELVEKHFKASVKKRGKKLVFERSSFEKLHSSLQIRLLKKALEESGGARGCNHHLQKMICLARDGETGASYALPLKRSFRKTRKTLEIFHA